MEGKAKVKEQAAHPFVEFRHSDFVQSTMHLEQISLDGLDPLGERDLSTVRL
jgi:hypothetical protein